MARLIYSAIASLDGYIADEHGTFDWATPDEQVHMFVNELMRSAGTYLYGRRMYEVMAAWESMDLSGQPPSIRDFAEIWRAADKIVYSTTLATASTSRTSIEPEFDADAVRTMKASADRDLFIGGPGLAASGFRAGLVDECQLFVAPVVVGGGTRCFPTGVFLPLDLADERRFANGMVFLRYRRRAP